MAGSSPYNGPPFFGAGPMDNPAPLIEIRINGEPHRLSACTLAHWLDHAGLAGKRVAIERNGEIVPRSLYAQTALADGDRLEVVVAVGGG